jgi:hypothetical protein
MSQSTAVPYTRSNAQITFPYWARMKFWLLTLLTFNFAFLISACGLDIEDPTPPSAPVWVQKSLPEEWPERGIDAHESGGIYLEWMPDSSDRTINAYYIFRAEQFESKDSLSDYTILTSQSVASFPALEYVDNTASLNAKYFYKLKAEDYSTNLSDYSDSVSYKLLPSISDLTMDPNGPLQELDIDRSLSWRYVYMISMENYCITILTEDNIILTRRIFDPRSYHGDVESWNIPLDVILEPEMSYKWRVDMGGQYINDRENAGSESKWASFVYSDR